MSLDEYGWGAPVYRRMIPHDLCYGSFSAFNSTDQRVYLMPLSLPFDCTIEKIGWINGANVEGKLIAGIYADNGDTPVGGALLATSAEHTLAGAAHNKEEVALTADLSLRAGLYWLAILSIDVAAAVPDFKKQDTSLKGGGTLLAGYDDCGQDTLPDPAARDGTTDIPFAYVLVKSVP